MTPAITLSKKKKIAFKLHSYKVHPDTDSYGKEAAKALNLRADRIFKTLVTTLNGEVKNLAVAIVPVCGKLDLKLYAKAVGAKKAEMAPKDIVAKATGYVLGGVSPLGQKKQLPTVLDESALNFETIYVSAGKRGLQIEMKPQDLANLSRANLEKISL